MNLKASVVVLVVVALAITGFCGSAPAMDVARDGRVRTAIHYRRGSDEKVRQGAEELSRVLGEMTGTKLTTQPLDRAGQIGDRPAIVLGTLAEQAGLAMNAGSISRDGFRYAVKGNRVLIVGESPRGIYIGIHDLLERFGCGWYAPGEVGEVIPKKADLSLPDDLDHTETSTAMHRRFWYGGQSTSGVETDWLERLNGNFLAGSWRHAYAHLVPRSHFEEHPEWFSLRNGKRSTHQLCTTNEAVKRIAAQRLIEDMDRTDDQWVFAAGPNDGGGLCEGPRCMKLRTEGYTEPSSGNLNASSQVFKFAADLADRTSRQHPDKYLGILVYSDYSREPRKIEQVSPNVFPMIAPIRRCRLHGPGNPNCEWNQLLAEEIQAWAKLSQGTLGFYIYNYNLADTLVPFSKITAFKRYQEQIQEADIKRLAWTMETIDSWTTHAPHMWLSVRLSWDVNIDIDREMDRFFNGFYGAAAEPMKRYWLSIDEAYATTDAHTGSQYALHHVWTPELLAGSRRDINEAKKLASNAREKEAVAMADAGLRCAELFMASWNALGRFEFQRAAGIEAQLKQHIHAHADRNHVPSWFHEKYAYGYHRRFVAGTINAGAKIMEQGGSVVTKLPDQWKFSTDKQGIGAQKGWFQPGFDDSGWRTVGTFSQSWSDIGIGMEGFYHGDVWYRTTVEVPAGARGEDLRLWFGGFDHNVDVYVNGKHLGEKRGFMRPAEFKDVASALKFGAGNVIAVRCNSGGLAELGTGGIMMPVMIYAAPAEGEAGEGRQGQEGEGYEM